MDTVKPKPKSKPSPSLMGRGDSGNPPLPSPELLSRDHNFTEAADGVFNASGQSAAHQVSYLIGLIIVALFLFCF